MKTSIKLINIKLILVYLVLLHTSQAFAYKQYESGLVTFTDAGNNNVYLKFLVYDDYSKDDELDCMNIYVLNQDGNWDEILGGVQCKHSAKNLFAERINSNYVIGVLSKTKHGDKSYGNVTLRFNEDYFDGAAIFKVEVDWDENHNGTEDRKTFYYTYRGLECMNFEPSLFYDALNNELNVNFPISSKIGYEAAGISTIRHQLTNIKLFYLNDAEEQEGIMEANCIALNDNDAIAVTSISDAYKYFTSYSDEDGVLERRWVNFKLQEPENWPSDMFGESVTFDIIAEWSTYGISSSVKYYPFKNVNIYVYGEEPVLDYANFDVCKGETALEWSFDDKNKTGISQVKVQRKTETESDFSDLESNLNSNTTSYNDLSPEQGTNEYRLAIEYECNSGVWFYSEAKSVEVDFTPPMLESLKISLDSVSEYRSDVIITWGAINCSAVTGLKIERIDSEGNGTNSEVSLSPNKTSFVDNSAPSCTTFHYRITIEGEKSSSEMITENMKYVPDLSHVIQDFDASKGNFSDKVILDWKCDDADQLTKYIIYRRIYGSGSDFARLYTTENNQPLQYIDNSTEAGVYYEYKIEGIAQCEDGDAISNMLYAVGFRRPTGTITGQINFEGGTSVEGVRVGVDLAGSGEQNMGSCLLFDASDSLSIAGDNLVFDGGFTSELWFRMNAGTAASELVLFDNRKDSIGYKLIYLPISNMFKYYIGSSSGVEISSVETIYTGEYNHIAFSYDAGVVKLFFNGNEVYRAAADFYGSPNRLSIGYGLKGYIDEIRLWNYGLDEEEISSNMGRLLTGEEDGLIGYWRLDEGFGEYIFDMSKQNFEYNKNHGLRHSAMWSTNVPPLSKLALCGVTDEYGNYTISGIHFKGSGQSFKITPMLGQHTFDPGNRSLFIGGSALIHNNKDFLDVSSFQVTGNVKYQNTSFPVEDVYVLLDGEYVQGSDKQPVMSDLYGNFSIDVPIGNHYISLEKNGHSFAHAYFPERTMAGGDTTINLYNFTEPISGLTFYDVTTVTLAGRVVGGTREGDKEIGFGKSTNNIGTSSIELSTEKGFVLNDEGDRSISFTTDPATGEYSIDLLPERYTVLDVSVNDRPEYYIDEEAYGNIIDMEEALNTDSVATDTVKHWDESTNSFVTDSVRKFSYNLRKDWIYRSEPMMTATALDGSPYFYDASFSYVDENDEQQEIALINSDGSDFFAHPILTSGNRYKLNIAVFEEYTNNEILTADSIDRVPVSDGVASINTYLDLDADQVELYLDENGMVVYEFVAGLPILEADPETPENSYTGTMDISVKTGGGKYISWPAEDDGGVFRAYVLGAKSTGNDFVTTGPTFVDFILRDPPGSDSYAFLEKGFSLTEEVSYSVSSGSDSKNEIEMSYGISTTISTGFIGFMVDQVIDITNDVNITFNQSSTSLNDSTRSETYTFNQAYSTSSSSNFVGSKGDVFIGHSTNIVYGESNEFSIVKESEIVDGQTSTDPVNGFAIALSKGIVYNPEFATAFIYTKNHIENYLIPNLKMLRNNLFISQPEKYISWVDPEDERYGTNNDDLVWGADAKPSGDQGEDETYERSGPSYTYIPNELPANFYTLSEEERVDTLTSIWEEDSIRWFNNQIYQWEQILAQNEREKLNAELDTDEKTGAVYENISFDAGSSYDGTIGTSAVTSKTHTSEWTTNAGLAYALGAEVNGSGLTNILSSSLSSGGSGSESTTTEESQTIGFHLEDSDEGDYFTVDVKKCKAGNGPVFTTRGGRSSCPYEGEELTQYFAEGTELNAATMRREVPTIAVENAVVSNVPENNPAVYNVVLGNASESGDDLWFDISVDATTNPDGAIIKMDGYESQSVFIPAGEVLNKTVELYKGPEANEYKDIKLVISSQCGDVSDEVYISANFVPACSEVNISEPSDLWIVNDDDDDMLDIVIDGYDKNLSTFDKVELQYRAMSSSQWYTLHTWFKSADSESYETYQGAEEDRTLMGNSILLPYQWDMSALADREYLIRAKSTCLDGSIYTSDPLSGVLDGQRPLAFGTPQPADGILSTGEDISIRFNESIQEGLLLPYNFSLKGVLNGTNVGDDVSVQFDGLRAAVETGEGLNLADKSFSLEFWAKIDDYTNDGTILSYLSETGEGLSLSLSDGKMKLTMNNSEGTFACNTDGAWHHYAIVYNISDKNLILMEDDGNTAEDLVLELVNCTPLSENSTIVLGYNGTGLSFEGCMHSLRAWSRVLLNTDVVYRLRSQLSGSEMGLDGCWPMDEAWGEFLEDKASGRHATANKYISWNVQPAGKSYRFSGDDVLTANTSSVSIDDDMDMTIEFWFKGGVSAKGSTLLSNGNPEATLTEDLQYTLSIGINANGQIEVNSFGENVLSSLSVVTDNQWHHLALVVRRRSNANLFIDGSIESSMQGSDFGAFSSAYTCIGALATKTELGLPEASDFFVGNIDELRIWNVARTQELLSLYRHARVDGDEAGLLAYFPFETYALNAYEVYESTTTLEDQSIDVTTGLSHCGELQFMGNNVFSSLTPNIKRERKVSAVNFDFVVNDDQIIITPTDPDEMLENCIVEISVDGVVDMNDNVMASPEVWTAYFDQNTLSWNASEMEIEKLVNEEMTFEMVVLNNGGSYENYSIEDLPSWLTAEPSSGIIAPTQEQTIVFTVDAGVNIGSYNEKVYLSNDFGFDETFNLALKVKGDDSDWYIDASQYSLSMSIIGRLYVNGISSSDTDDRIAAFVGDECRGVAHVEYFSAIDEYYVMLDVYGDTNGDEVTYRAYDASSGIIYGLNNDIDFVAQTIHGDFVSPIEFVSGTAVQNVITLNAGWSWISFNASLDNYEDAPSLLRSLDVEEGDRLVEDAEMVYLRYENDDLGWQGTLNTAKEGILYRLFAQNGGKLTYDGVMLNSEEYEMHLSQGWNRIGYIPNENMGVNEALSAYDAALGDIIKGQVGFAMYNGDGWVGSLSYLEPGEGYMLKRTAADSTQFKYPMATALKSTSVSASQPSDLEASLFRFSGNTSVLAELSGLDLDGSEQILSYIGGEFRGIVDVSADYQFISVAGDLSDIGKDIEFRLQKGGDVYALKGSCRFAGNDVVGSFYSPVLLSLGEKMYTSEANNIELQVVPSPIKETAAIQITLPGESPLNVEVYDISGKLVYQSEKLNGLSGLNVLKWNTSGISNGMYFVHARTDYESKIISVIK